MDGRLRFRGALVPALRRVDGVRLVVGDHEVRAEVYGLGHRHPVTRPLSLRMATRLVEAGAPLCVRVEHDATVAAP